MGHIVESDGCLAIFNIYKEELGCSLVIYISTCRLGKDEVLHQQQVVERRK